LVLRWSGSKWDPMSVPPHGTDTILSGVAVNSATSAVAVGWFAPNSSASNHSFAEVWDGHSWTVSLPPTFKDGTTYEPTQLNHAAPAPGGGVWAVGYHITAAHVEVPLIERWAGGGWSVASNSTAADGASLTDVASDASGDAWAVGSQSPTLGSSAPFAKHFTGSTWQTVSTPTVNTFPQLDGVSVVGASDAWAVGSSVSGSVDVPLAMHWDGAHWTLVSVPNPSANGAGLRSVTALGANDVWAFGVQNTDQFGHTGPLIEHWNGSAWSIVPSAPGSPPAGDEGVLGGSTFTGGHVLAVGYNEPDNTSAGATASQQLCPVQVQDAGYVPTPATAGMGATVYWSVPASDTAGHSITDGNGTGLGNSGVLAPGSSFSFQFNAAANYTVTDTATGHVGRVVVPMSAQPASGTTTTTFTLQWATAGPPAGDVYDIQIERPGASAFSTWRSAQTTTGASFTPDGGAGTYAFRARLRRLSPKGQTSYSPASRIAVS
jgi:hypothetical protein